MQSWCNKLLSIHFRYSLEHVHTRVYTCFNIIIEIIMIGLTSVVLIVLFRTSRASLCDCTYTCPLLSPNCTTTYWDECRCCERCAGQVSERCGGRHSTAGTCADGLRCVYRHSDIYGRDGVGHCETGKRITRVGVSY